MTSPSNRLIQIILTVQPDQPALLEGLEVWLRLGLISDAQVKHLCRDHLVCSVPTPVVATSQPSQSNDFVSDLVETPPRTRQTPAARKTRANREPSHPATQVLQSFMAEVSVLWLLFLGVFLVVVSSAVLAASQWRNFSPVGQYGILFAYTLVFWGLSTWAGRQPNLGLTAGMLRVTTLLIVPVNFWMMDGFKLWGSPLGWIVAAIAAFSLTAILVNLLQPSIAPSSNPRLTLANSIGLSWLHWGWSLTGFPLIATYIGTVGTAFILFYQSRAWGIGHRENLTSPPTPLLQGEGSNTSAYPQENSTSPPTPLLQGEGSNTPPFPRREGGPGGLGLSRFVASNPSLSASFLSFGSIAIAFATLLLVGRAVLAAKVPISQLGLALGICGWLLCWLSRRDRTFEIWAKVGVGLLLVGWIVSVREMPEQAIAVSGLGIWLLADRLQRLKQTPDLVALFLVGLQSFWLLWRIIPYTWRESIITFGIQLAGNEFMPLALIGIGVFPYVVVMVSLAAFLRQQKQPKLALQSEAMALILGFVLTLISFFNPLVIAINLLLSLLTLAVVVRNRAEAETELIYLTHIAGLATIAAWINFALPKLTVNAWLGILLAGAIAQWVLSVGTRFPRWRRSSWHLGLVLAAISYTQLLNFNLVEPTYWRLAWFIIPAALTLLTYFPNFPERRLASLLSVIALVLIQPLNLESATPRLVSLGIATVIMLLNTQRLQELVLPALTVGFGLCFSGAVVWQVFSPRMTFGWWVTVVAIASLILWLVYSWLKLGSSRLHQLYMQATDGWAIVLTIPVFTFLIGYNVTTYLYPSIIAWEFISAAAILTIALIYRTWQQPKNWGFYSLALAVELLVASIITSNGRSLDWLAIATLALGLTTQLAGDFWSRDNLTSPPTPLLQGEGSNTPPFRQDNATSPPTPLLQGEGNNTPPFPRREGGPGGLGQSRFRLVAENTSSPYLSSWHVIPIFYAILGLIVSHHTFNAYTGLYTLAAALVGIGIGRRSVNFKAISYLSILGVSAAAYELLVYQLLQAKEGSPGDGFTLLAALAAAIAIGERLLSRWLLPYLRLNAPELRVIAHMHWVAGSTLIVLALASSLSTSGEKVWLAVTTVLALYALIQGRLTESWTYAGIVELGLAIGYGLDLILPDSVLLNWSAAIACFFAFFMHILPWTSWGWSATPWRNSAILLPVTIVVLTSSSITIQSLLLVAAFYAWLAKAQSQVRISYISILFANWAIIRMLNEQSVNEPLWYALLCGGSLLYIAQVDPELRSQSAYDTRHILRSLATGIICFTALYQAEIGIQGFSPLLLGFLTIGLGLVFVLLGIVLHVRAFLYIGTLEFILGVLRQVWLFINDYSLFLWAIGIAFGSLLIWIALTFEARRSQAIAFVQYWLTELENWE